MNKLNVTPMMRQYLDIKDENPDCVIFFRMGDFYEMFFEDAVTVSRELEITLTGRDCGLSERAPMCGVPFHAADNYVARLVEKGFKVAICEQLEDPSTTKGLVKRGVVRIVTPGTILEGSTIQEGKNNYITSLVRTEDHYGLSLCDVTTGEWLVTEVSIDQGDHKLMDELAKFAPVECLLDHRVYTDTKLPTHLKDRFNALVEEIPDHVLDYDLCEKLLLNHFHILGLDGIGLSNHPACVLACSSLLNYLKETQKNELSHLGQITFYNVNEFMLLDSATRRNLELTETLREKKRKGSLLHVLDHTQTAMGARYLRKCVEQPLIHQEAINARLSATEELKESLFLRDDIKASLSAIYDMERLVGRIAYGTCNAKDLIALKESLRVLPELHGHLETTTSHALRAMYNSFDDLSDLFERIDVSIIDEPPISLREGGLIKGGYNQEIDELRDVKTHGTNWLRDVETKEKEQTGIKNLKIKYNKVFGYFLEVTQSYNHLVPDYFIRKQTLSNCERYITEELKTIEEKILGADEKLQALEYKLFTEIRDFIAEHMDRLLRMSRLVAELDMLTSLAIAAEVNGYVKPLIDESDTLNIVGGRHPVVEKIIGQHQFIANDVYLNETDHQINLITGPNMAGKSTFMRQTALIVLMAQMGSFVPAESAHIGVVDRIFTRVGASDDLASGQSTFMVEMMEVSNILHHATKKSLLILDEIGRGTSTIDGLSIAWAIIEHIANHNKLGAKTLFATHYHELTELEKTIPSLRNYCVQVKEMGETIIFLHKIVPGSVDHSYGIQVAHLAGLPKEVLDRAHAIMAEIEGESSRDLRAVVETSSKAVEEHKLQTEQNTVPASAHVEASQASLIAEPISLAQTVSPSGQVSLLEPAQATPPAQMSLLGGSDLHVEIIDALEDADLMNMTPFEAMQLLFELKNQLNGKGSKKKKSRR
nr:DNA mismatch repair protein MutS [Niameybacter massiliensis]